MSIEARFSSHAEARRQGWFSRRHETNGAHQQNQLDRAEVRDIEGCNQDWAKLSPAQKLKSLDARLGKGVGATRQRRKLS